MKPTNKEDEYVMYIVVNHSLKMGKGKIAAQACHSATRVVRFLENFPKRPLYYNRWLNTNEPKIVLKASQEQMKEILEAHRIKRHEDVKGYWCLYTIDCGRTQIKAGSLTTIAFRPMKRSEAPAVLKSLKLL